MDRNTFPSAAASVDYDLGAWLLTCRLAGLSYREIARWLRDEDDVIVSHETLRRWIADLSETRLIP